MTGGQFFALCATIYIAPRLSPRVGWTLAAICMLGSVISKIGEGA